MASQGYYNNAAPVGHVNAAPATTHHYGAGAPPKEDFVTTHADKRMHPLRSRSIIKENRSFGVMLITLKSTDGAALQQKMGIKETEKTRKYRRKIVSYSSSSSSCFCLFLIELLPYA